LTFHIGSGKTPQKIGKKTFRGKKGEETFRREQRRTEE